MNKYLNSRAPVGILSRNSGFRQEGGNPRAQEKAHLLRLRLPQQLYEVCVIFTPLLQGRRLRLESGHHLPLIFPSPRSSVPGDPAVLGGAEWPDSPPSAPGTEPPAQDPGIRFEPPGPRSSLFHPNRPMAVPVPAPNVKPSLVQPLLFHGGF